LLFDTTAIDALLYR